MRNRQKFLHSFSFSIAHVMREANTNADELANLGIDKQGKISQAMAFALKAYGVTID